MQTALGGFSRLQPLEYDHFWLSETLDVIGSQTWGGCCPRMVTWVRFKDKATSKEFYAVNTHLEAYDATARSKSADLILQRIACFDPALPVVLTPSGGVLDPLALITEGPPSQIVARGS